MPAPKGHRIASKCHRERPAYAQGLCEVCFFDYWRKSEADRRERKRKRDVKSSLKKQFGLTPEDYDAMLALQSGGCAICGRSPYSKRFTRLAVDHDHQSGSIRGLLCHRCNVGIGMFDDRPEVLRRAIRYLDEHAA